MLSRSPLTHQRRDRGIGRLRVDGRLGARRARPAQAGRRPLVRQRGPLGARERRELRGRQRGSGRRQLLPASLERRRGIPHLRVVVARDREVERVRERAHGRRVGNELRLGHEPQQRRAVAVLERVQRGEQVAVHRQVAVARLDDRGERRDVEQHAGPRALAVDADAAHRPRADALDDPLQHGERILARAPRSSAVARRRAAAPARWPRRGRPARGRCRAADTCRRGRASAGGPDG